MLSSIVSDGLLGRDWGDDESWIQLHEVQAQRLEFRIPMPGFRGLLRVNPRQTLDRQYRG